MGVFLVSVAVFCGLIIVVHNVTSFENATLSNATLNPNYTGVPNTTVCSTTLDDNLWKAMSVNGVCEPYADTTSNRISLCDARFTIGTTLVYIPNSRLGGDQSAVRKVMEEISGILSLLSPKCQAPIKAMTCTHIYLTCGSNGIYNVPRFLCPNVCRYISEVLCLQEVQLLSHVVNTQVEPEFRDDPGLQLPNCSFTDDLIAFLNLTADCCTDAGITLPSESVTQLSSLITSTQVIKETNTFLNHQHHPASSATVAVAPSVQSSGLIVGILTPTLITFFCIVLSIIAITFLYVFYVMKKRRRSFAHHENEKIAAETYPIQKISENQNNYTSKNALDNNEIFASSYMPKRKHPRIPAVYLRHLSSYMIHSSDISAQELIGQGEFGIVYRATLTTKKDCMPMVVAVKTLKRTFSDNDFEAFIEEMMKMQKFNHLNVLSLVGVCLDLNEAPCIVMPFMSEGSLLSYLKRERPQLSIVENISADEEFINNITKQLLSMCLQVACGMEYLSKTKFVHRDLAARNCMMSSDGVIKVADFGLTEDVYTKDYFRLHMADDSSKSQAKLPIKWMALESIHDGLYSEKTDVWSYGILCWEVFNLGRTPYPGMTPREVVEFLDSGERLDKPKNIACSDQIYVFIESCWNLNPDDRRSFSDIVFTMNELIQPLANYMDFASFFSQTNSTTNEEHLI